MPASTAELAEALRAQIRLAPGESLYGIVDSARDLELAYEAKCLYQQEIWSLFEGDAAEAVCDVAPFFMMIDPASGYIENWVSRWGKCAGILFTTSTDPYSLFAHLRHLFISEDESGQEYFFRFYDPRVITPYLPTCTPQELALFFGPIHSIIAEDPSGEAPLCFSLGPTGLTTHKVSEEQWRSLGEAH
jgi:Domain of unknown function (DUF4123)